MGLLKRNAANTPTKIIVRIITITHPIPTYPEFKSYLTQAATHANAFHNTEKETFLVLLARRSAVLLPD